MEVEPICIKIDISAGLEFDSKILSTRNSHCRDYLVTYKKYSMLHGPSVGKMY